MRNRLTFGTSAGRFAKISRGRPFDGSRAGARSGHGPGHGERGSSLILALIYIVAISLVVGALAGWVMDDLTNTTHFKAAANRDYAATAAAEVAIADIRYSPYGTQSTFGNCWAPTAPATVSGFGNGSTSLPVDGFTMAVWCSTFQNLSAPINTRVVTFEICQESTLAIANAAAAQTQCNSDPLLLAKVGFDDNPPGGELLSTCTATCGETAATQEWIWGGGSPTPGLPTQVVFSVEPPSSTTAGATLAGFAVSVEDANSVVESAGYTGASDNIALTASAGCTLGGTDTATASNGIATFSAVTITAGSSCTLTATDTTRTIATATSSPATTLTASTASKVVFTTAPPTSAVAGTNLASFSVSVEDQYGNVETSGNGSSDVITLTASGCGLSGTDTATASSGVATFNAVDFTKVGTCTLTATDSTEAIATATSASIAVQPGAASKVVFTTAPATPIANGGSLGATVVATVEDANGNTVTGSTATVSLTSSAGGTLGGTTSKAATNGVASFSGLTLSGLENTYTITAASTGLTSATASVTINAAGAAFKVVYTTPPTTPIASSGASIGTVVVTIEDASGNTVTSSGATVALASSAGGTLGGTTSKAATNGVATFTGVTLSGTVGNTYTITASSGSLATATASVKIN